MSKDTNDIEEIETEINLGALRSEAETIFLPKRTVDHDDVLR